MGGYGRVMVWWGMVAIGREGMGGWVDGWKVRRRRGSDVGVRVWQV